MTVTDETNIVDLGLNKISKDEIYELAGIKVKKSTTNSKSKGKKELDPQIQLFFKNRNVTTFVKELYNQGKSHQNIANFLNKIGKSKFKPNNKGKVPSISEAMLFDFCIEKKIGSEVLRKKNIENGKMINIDLENIPEEFIYRIKSYGFEHNDFDTENIIKTILLKYQNDEINRKWSKEVIIPFEIVQDIVNMNSDYSNNESIKDYKNYYKITIDDIKTKEKEKNKRILSYEKKD